MQELNEIIIEPDQLSRSTHIKETAKKSLVLIGVSGVDIAAEFLKIYLFSTLGIEVLAASGLIYATTKVVIDPMLILGNQNAVYISQEFGKLKVPQLRQSDEPFDELSETKLIQKNIGNILRQGWYLGALCSVPCMIALYGIRPILTSFGITADIATIVSDYFFPIIFSLPALMAMNINERFFSAVDEEKWLPFYKVLLDALNIGLNILLIPRMGSRGAGFAVLLQVLVGYAITTSFIVLKNTFKPYRLLDLSYSSGSYMRRMLVQGSPTAIALLALTGANFTIAIFIGTLGKSRLAIEQTIVQYFAIATTLAHGINEASNRLVAQAFGQRQYVLMKEYGNIGLISSATLFAGIALIYNCIPLQLASVFMQKTDVTASEDYLRYTFLLISLAKLFSVIQESTSLNLAAMDDTLIASVISFTSTLAIILPLSAISVYLTNFDIYGISGAITIGLMFAAGMTVKQWFKQSNSAVNSDDFDAHDNTSNAKFSSFMRNISFFKMNDQSRLKYLENNIEEVNSQQMDETPAKSDDELGDINEEGNNKAKAATFT